MKNIITDGPLTAPDVNGPDVNSSNIGDAHDATPIDGHEVHLRVTRDEVAGRSDD